MLKFLRQYNKILLVGFGVFIMISFLVPQLLQQMGRGGIETVVMTVDGRGVTEAERQLAAKQADAIVRVTSGLLPGNAGVDPRGDHWLKLRLEAEQAGFVGGPAFGRGLLREIPPALVGARLQQQFGPRWQQMMLSNPQFQEQFTKEVDRLQPEVENSRRALEGSISRQPEDIDQALAAMRGIALMKNAYRTAPRLSEPRLAARARELLDETELEVLFIDVKNRLADGLPPRTPEALSQQFAAYRAVPPGSGAYGFSYLLPPRFKLEYLKVDRPSIDAVIRVDPVEVQKRVLAAGDVKPEQLADKRREVEEALRREQAEQIMTEAATAVKSALLTALIRVPEEAGYRKLPENWQPPDLQAIADSIPAKLYERFKINVPAPMVVRPGAGWIPADDLYTLGEVHFAAIRRGSNSIQFPQVMMMTREMLPANAPTPAVAVQAGVPLVEPLLDRVNSRYFLMVTGALPQSPAQTLDEVRADVERDRKRLDAYEDLKGRLDVFRTEAADAGIDALAATIKTQLDAPTEIRRVRVSGLGVQNGTPALNDPAFVKAVRAASTKIDPAVPLDSLGAGDRVVAVELPRHLGVAVARITGYIPMTQEQFRQRASGLLAALSAEDLGRNADDPFKPERLARRLNVTYRGQREDAKAEAEKAAKAEQPPVPADGPPADEVPASAPSAP